MAINWPQDLIEELNSRRVPVSVWIGAGLAMPLGYPSWEKLIQDLIERAYEKLPQVGARDADLKVAENWCRSGNFEMAAQQCQDVIGETRFWQILTDILDIEENREFWDIYEDLLYIPFTGYITTNYNVTLSQVARRLANNDANFCRPQDLLFPNISPRSLNDRSIVYLHGNIHNIRDVILTERSYRNAYTDSSSLSYVLGKLFSEHTLVFIGTSFGDHDVRRVLNQVDQVLQSTDPQDMPRRYALVSYREEEGIPGTHSLKTTYHITPLYFPIRSECVELADNPEIEEKVEDPYSELYESIRHLRDLIRLYPLPPRF